MSGDTQAVPAASPSRPRSGGARILSTVVAIGSLILLADAAVETFWGGSPFRWWVSPSAAIFVALSVWLWKPGGSAARRWGWSGAAAWSLYGLLLLLAVTAWLPEGLTNGVRVLMQPTAVVLTAATAAAVLLAAYVLFRASGMLTGTLRLAARGVVMALAVYALASLVLAVHARAPFAALFQGGAAWQRLPRWLQGTYIGALVLVPLALLGEVVRILDHIRRKQSIRVLLHQTTALVMSGVMAASGLVLPRRERAMSPTTQSVMKTAAGSPAQVSTAAANYEKTRQESLRILANMPTGSAYSQSQLLNTITAGFDAIDALLSKMPRDSFDPAAVVRLAGNDPTRLFEWVRDHTGWVPYRGTLRGPSGVLMDRTGNSLDRALLLATLMKIAGRSARLAHGTLAPAQLKALQAASTRPPAGTPSPEEMQVASQALAKVSMPGASNPSAIRDAIARRGEAASDLMAGTRAVAEAQSAALFDALGGPVKTSDDPDQAEGADHWWLQVDDAGSWKDFDPSLPGSRAGEALTAAAETMAPQDLPSRLRHEVAVRVIVEQYAGGRLSERVALEEYIRVADDGTLITLANVPLGLPAKAAKTTSGPLRDVLTRVAGDEKAWLPVLMVGERPVAQRVFGTNGQLVALPSTAGSLPEAAQTAASAAGSLFGAEQTDSTLRTDGAQDGELTGEWIE